MQIKKKAAATKQFVQDHKVAIAVTATSIVWYSLVQSRASQPRSSERIPEGDDLYETFWSTEEL